MFSIAAGFKTRNAPALHTHTRTHARTCALAHTQAMCDVSKYNHVCVCAQPNVQGVTPHPSAVLFISLDAHTHRCLGTYTADRIVLISMQLACGQQEFCLNRVTRQTAGQSTAS